MPCIFIPLTAYVWSRLISSLCLIFSLLAWRFSLWSLTLSMSKFIAISMHLITLDRSPKKLKSYTFFPRDAYSPIELSDNFHISCLQASYMINEIVFVSLLTIIPSTLYEKVSTQSEANSFFTSVIHFLSRKEEPATTRFQMEHFIVKNRPHMQWFLVVSFFYTNLLTWLV